MRLCRALRRGSWRHHKPIFHVCEGLGRERSPSSGGIQLLGSGEPDQLAGTGSHIGPMIDVEVEYGRRCGRILAERIGALHTPANQPQRLGQHAGIVAY